MARSNSKANAKSGPGDQRRQPPTQSEAAARADIAYTTTADGRESLDLEPYKIAGARKKPPRGSSGSGKNLTPIERMPVRLHKNQGGISQIWSMSRDLPGFLRTRPEAGPGGAGAGETLESSAVAAAARVSDAAREDARESRRDGEPRMGGRGWGDGKEEEDGKKKVEGEWRELDYKQWTAVDVGMDIGRPW